MPERWYSETLQSSSDLVAIITNAAFFAYLDASFPSESVYDSLTQHRRNNDKRFGAIQ